ncbi:hypothetical protein KEC48_03395 [Clostridium sp. C1]|uniref:hypothetical protein n=1 Tax=Clostridium sp. C1 TaxID=1155388 RepID=UPI001BAD3C74|nr:hypothetical protein [Clostridium sp. C1]QUN13584.1 hypothetical protein KEC48_03395 [Clostridium sp. C1]
MLTKEECIYALNKMINTSYSRWYRRHGKTTKPYFLDGFHKNPVYKGDYKALKVIDKLIKEYFELLEKFNEMERTIHLLECKLADVYYPRAYEFKELKKGMWVWYKPFKECKKIRELSDNDKKFKWIEFEDGFVIEYEDCQFFPVTKAMEYQE